MFRQRNCSPACRKKWRAALRSPSDLWDGYRAVEELKQAAYPVAGNERIGSALNLVRCDDQTGWRPQEMLGRILKEVKDYKEKKQAWQKEFKDTELLLASIARRVKRRNCRTSNPELKGLLDDTSHLVEKRRAAVAAYRQGNGRSPLGIWEGVSGFPSRVENIRRGTDLDTRLQIQAAKMLRNFLSLEDGVSLRTVARLVVLLTVPGS